MWDAICETCSRYIHNTEEPLRWLPIVALAWLLFYRRHLLWFWSDRKYPMPQDIPLQWQIQWRAERLQRALFLAVAIFLSSLCISLFAVFDRRDSVSPNAPIHPIGDVKAIQPATTEPPTGAIGCSGIGEATDAESPPDDPEDASIKAGL